MYYSSKYPGRLPFLVVLFLCLSACATQVAFDERARLASWQANREKLSSLESWRLNGRIALSTDRDAWSASLYWTQAREEYYLRVVAPMSRGSFELQGGEHGVSMRLAQDKVLLADNPETLLAEHFGWSVPVSGLVYWIRGLPDPEMRISGLLLDDKGRVKQMNQSGWQVVYSDYSTLGQVDLPGRIVINSGKLRLRLIVRDWLI